MCAQFVLISKAKKLSFDDQIKIPENIEDYNIRVLPYQVAPVIAINKHQNSIMQLSPMSYSLVPSWSKEPKVKFATHNARIETVAEKPTWKEPFMTKHCLVPMSGFFESVYEGPEAGNIIKFSSTQNDLLLAAGIYDIWKDPNDLNKKLFSFSILTTEPSAYILEHGHDRSPIFLNFEDGKEWLHTQSEASNLIQLLLSKNQKLELTVSIDRPLKPGWEKRR